MAKVAIVIPTYNASILVENILNTIKTTTTYSNLEIIVVDNGGQDNTCDILKKFYPYVKTIKIPKNIGFPNAINMGIQLLKADYYLILSNDVFIVTKNWLEKLIDEMKKDQKIGMISGSITNLFGKTITKNTYKQIIKSYTRKNEKISLNYVSNIVAAALLVRRKAFETVGLFDEGFSPGYYEDEDLCCRMRTKGWKLAILNEIKIMHFTSSTFERMYSKAYAYFYLRLRNRIRFIILHPQFNKILYEPFLILRALGHILLKDNFDVKKMKLYYMISALKYNLKFLFNSRKLISIRKLA